MANEILTPATRYAQTTNLPTGWYVAEDMAEAVLAALLRFHDDLPRIVTAGFSGTGASSYDLSTALGVGSWDEDSSSVSDVAYPFTAADENSLDLSKYRVVEVPSTGKTLVFLDDAPTASETVRVRYSAPWTEATVPAKFRSAVAMLAAANYLRMIAARFAQQSEGTLSGDVFNRAGASTSMLKIADTYDSKYREVVVGGGGSTGAGAAAADAGPGAAVAWTQMGSGGQQGTGPLIDYEDVYGD